MNFLETYRALGDESRFRIVNMLSRGTFNVQELTATLELAQPTISHHLKILLAAGIVEQERQGTWSYYRLREPESSLAARLSHQGLAAITEAAIEPNRTLAQDNSAIEALLSRRRDQGKHFFENVAKNWGAMREEAIGGAFYADEVRTRIGASETVLELGCGSGALLERILPRQGTTIAVDFAASMLDEARRTLGSRAAGVDLRLGNLEHLPVADCSVDVVVAYMVLHHLPDPMAALREVWRVLRPEGRLLIVDLWAHNKEFMRDRFADVWLGFSAEQIQSWVKSAGLNECSIINLGDGSTVFLLEAKSLRGEIQHQ